MKCRVGLSVGLVALCACAPEPEGTIKIAVDLPLEGEIAPRSEPILNGVMLAIDEAGGAIGDYEVELVDFDHSGPEGFDLDLAAENTADIVADEQILAVIGPLNSGVAYVQIPISNAGGLLQCSPSNTSPGLTLPEEGADDLRTEENNYVRVVPHDGIQGPAGAAYYTYELGVTSVYVIDDAGVYGTGLADAFAAQFIAYGGSVVAHDSADPQTADYAALMTAAAALNPGAIYYGGTTANGGPDIRQAAVDAGLGDIPYMGGDGILDGAGGDDGSFINLTGAADAEDVYGTVPGAVEYEGRADFEAAYADAFGDPPPSGSYAPHGHACAQVALEAIEHALEEKPKDWAEFRAGARAAGTDPGHDWDTVLGTIRFDENGDTNQLTVSVYQVDATAAAGAGDWVYVEQYVYDPN